MHYVLYYKAVHAKEISGWTEMHKSAVQSYHQIFNLDLKNIWHVRVPVLKKWRSWNNFKGEICFSKDCYEDIWSPCISKCEALAWDTENENIKYLFLSELPFWK